MIRGKTLQLRLGENINVPKISGSPIRNTDCIMYCTIKGYFWFGYYRFLFQLDIIGKSLEIKH